MIFEPQAVSLAGMAKEKRDVILSIRVDDALARVIRELAAADNRPLSNYVDQLLRKHVAEKGIDLSKKRGQK
jgi:predicted transcriptional regulator